MRRCLFAAAATAALVCPASALATTSRGVVLSVDQRNHAIEVVDEAHAVHLYHYRGRLPKVHPGSQVVFARSGRAISRIKATSNASRTVVFDARVVRSSRAGVELRTADGRAVRFSAKQISHRSHPRPNQHKPRAATTLSFGSVSINLLGLQPGVTVVVTENTDAAGNLTITITLPPSLQAPAPQQASGVVTEVDDDAFLVAISDGSSLRLHMNADALSSLNLETCNTVNVSYHQDGGLVIADSVQVSGNSTGGDCTPTQEATGTIAQASDHGLTLTTSDGTMTFSAASSVTDGFQAGDVVDVTYTRAADGSLTASDVHYVEQNASGAVTAVQGANLTITEDDGGQSDAFIADPGNGVQITAQTFAGVAVGDRVDVTYHQSAGHLVADTVCDNGPASSGSGN